MSLNIKPQKAKHLHLEAEKKNPTFVGKKYAIFEKYDGWYGYLDFPSCVIHSRALREIPALRELSDAIRTNSPKTRGRLIFEIMIDGLEKNSFSELNGILNRKYEQADGAYIIVHDYIPDWKFDVPFKTRFAFAQEIVKRIDMQEVVIAPVIAVSTAVEHWKEAAFDIWSEGGEGVVLKDINAPYYPDKRNGSLLKIKEEVTVEMKVLEVIRGQGEHSHMAGKLLCIDEVNQKHEIGLGMMKHEQREAIMKDPFSIVDSVVEIKAMKKLKDGSYREPRFLAVRHDKEVHELG